MRFPREAKDKMKKKNKRMNIIMIAAIILIAVSGVMMVGSNKGWFDRASDTASVEQVSGSANIQRENIAYSVSANTALRNDDMLETKSGSRLTLEWGKNSVTLNENSEIKITNASNGDFSFELTKGEIFAVINKAESFGTMKFQDRTLDVKGTVFSVSIQTGSAGVNIYEGVVNVGEKESSDGNVISFAGDSVSVNKLNATSLNQFNIEQAQKAVSSRKLCFTKEELEKVVSDRQEEIKRTAEEQAKREAEIKAQGGTHAVINGQSSDSSSSAIGGGNDSSGKNILTCTITIRCDTILNNMGNLTPGKNAYVPSSGVILATSTVQFVEGETVFDVLKRACDYAGIALEYSWTPGYGSYYIEGINNLYEFDCGNESGWMYKVNGWFPNYGCSSYTLKGGDVIVWCYTCNGLGADVGGSVY